MTSLVGESVDVPPAWISAAEIIGRERWRTVMVLGATDVGKSVFCRYLRRYLPAQGIDLAFIDADIGQKDLGPPAAITLGYMDRSGACRPAEHFFVGSTNPAASILATVSGTARLVQRAQASCTLINTTGLVHGPGRRLKSYKIEAVAPDGLIAITRDGEVDALLRQHSFVPQVKVPASPAARRKSDAERRTRRRHSFRSYFMPSSEQSFNIDQLAFQRTSLFSGQPFTMAGAIYAERMPDGMIVAVGAPATLPRRAEVLPAGFEKSLLCGIADEEGRGAGLAIIETIDFDSRRIALRTPVQRERMAVVQFGSVRMDSDWNASLAPGALQSATGQSIDAF